MYLYDVAKYDVVLCKDMHSVRFVDMPPVIFIFQKRKRIGIFEPNWQNWRSIETTAPIPTKFCKTIKTITYSSSVAQTPNIRDGGRPPFRKTENRHKLVDEMSPNFAGATHACIDD